MDPSCSHRDIRTGRKILENPDPDLGSCLLLHLICSFLWFLFCLGTTVAMTDPSPQHFLTALNSFNSPELIQSLQRKLLPLHLSSFPPPSPKPFPLQDPGAAPAASHQNAQLKVKSFLLSFQCSHENPFLAEKPLGLVLAPEGLRSMEKLEEVGQEQMKTRTSSSEPPCSQRFGN